MTRKAAPAPEFRPDIEGLRGVAILSVFAVHSLPQSVQGGFVGVDVFFVLSGWLIAGITLRELAQRRFGARDFYRRRLRRLLPALLVVLGACLLFAAVAAIPADARLIGTHVAAGAGFVANIALWREAGYFDPASEYKPLLHLWSLGVEAQFYLLWPLLALVLQRCGRARWLCIAAVLAASLALNLGFVASHPKAVFFLLPARMWELLAGSLLAVLQHDGWVPALPRRGGAMAAAGLALLATALLVITPADRFPGAWALLPVGGTVLLLAAGPATVLARRVLAQPLLRFYGRISYPLYLWHWPLLTLPLLQGRDRDGGEHVLLLVLAVALAAATQRLVEQPLRAAPQALRVQALALAALAGGGAWLAMTDGGLGRLPAPVQDIARLHLHPDTGAYRPGRCFQHGGPGAAEFSAECVDEQPPGAPLLLLWGDSHAASLYPGLRRWATDTQVRLAQFTGPLCPPLLQPSTRQRPGCDVANREVIARVRELRPAAVVLMAAWHHYRRADDADAREITGLQRTLDALRDAGVRRVLVVGPLPVWRHDLPRLLLAAWRGDGQLPPRLSHGLRVDALAVDADIAALAAAGGAAYASPLALLCDARGCETIVQQDGRTWPLSFDVSHLGTAGAWRLAQALRGELQAAVAR